MVGEPRQVGATLQGLETEKVPFRAVINENLQSRRSEQLMNGPEPLQRSARKRCKLHLNRKASEVKPLADQRLEWRLPDRFVTRAAICEAH
jgi:hypothetical protein